MIRNSDLRRSVDEYVKRRIREATIDSSQQIQYVTRVWKCDNAVDFLYGYYLGKIEEGAIHFILKAIKGGKFQLDAMELREIIETHKNEIRKAIYDEFNKTQSNTNTS